jgi:hypothetical protein
MESAMTGDLTAQLADRLEMHLDQLCDRNACQTPEHDQTRALIARARQYVPIDWPTGLHLERDPGAGFPPGLCAVREEHDPHLHMSDSLGRFLCTADQSQREPNRSQRAQDARA